MKKKSNVKTAKTGGFRVIKNSRSVVLTPSHILKLRHGRRKNSVDRKKRKFLGTTRGRTGSWRKTI